MNQKKAVGCGVGRSSSPIPHSRLPIPKGGVMWGGEPPYSSGILPAFPASH